MFAILSDDKHSSMRRVDNMRGLIVDFVGVLDGTEEDVKRWRELFAAAKSNGVATAILSNDPGGPAQARSIFASGNTAASLMPSCFPVRSARKSRIVLPSRLQRTLSTCRLMTASW